MELDKNRTAVLGLHWLNDIVTAEGAFGSWFAKMAEATGVIANTGKLFASARKAGVPIIYTRVCFRPGYPDLIPTGPLLGAVKASGALVDGSEGAQIIPPLAPERGDVVVDHRRISGFWATDLDLILRASSVDTLVLTGVATNVTVEGTGRDAINLGYRTIVVTDCTSTTDEAAHEASLNTMRVIGECTSSAEIIAALQA